jgi:hypothetical protein
MNREEPDFWNAMIRGLTLEKSEDISLWWKVPLTIFVIMTFLTLF